MRTYASAILVFLLTFLACPLYLAGAEEEDPGEISEDRYIVTDDEGKALWTIEGTGAENFLGGRSVTVLDYWFSSDEIVVDGQTMGLAEFKRTFGFTVLEAPPEETSEPEPERPLTMDELLGAIKLTLGEDGENMLATLTRLGWTIEIGGVTGDAQAWLGDKKIYIEEDVTPIRGAELFDDAFKGRSTFGNVQNMLMAEMVSSPEEAIALVNDAKKRMAEWAKFGIEGGVMIYSMAVPGVGYGIAIAELSEGNWDAAVELIPLVRLPAGGVLKIYNKTKTRVLASYSAEVLEVLRDVSLTFQEKLSLVARQVNVVALRPLMRKLFCFPAGTQVATPRGMIAIESLVPGDAVFGHNEVTGKTTIEVVEATGSKRAPSIVELTLFKQSKTETIRCTPDHPVLSIDPVWGEVWREAGQLVAGDLVTTASDGPALLTSVTHASKEEQVFAIAVSGDSTYLVGELGLIVHNGKCLKKILEDYGINVIEVLKGEFVQEGLQIMAAIVANPAGYKMLKALMRRAQPGYHEWIPLANILKLYRLAPNGSVKLSKATIARVVNVMDKVRTQTARIKFTGKELTKAGNPKYGHVGSGLPWKYSHEFHEGLNRAFDEAIKSGTFNKQTWLNEVRGVCSDFFNKADAKQLMKEITDALAPL